MVCADSEGNCTLRAAIQEANALTSCGVIDIDFSVTGTINTTSVLSVIHSININGPGANLLTVANNNSSVVFDLPQAAPVISINRLTITDGNGTSLVAGGINNSSTLTIDGCHITGNVGKFSGAIHNFGTLTILNTTISNNTATLSGFNNGGGMSNQGTLTITSSTISGNTANANGNANGGILNFSGTSILTNCTITNNAANPSGSGGGISAGGVKVNGGMVTARNSIIAANLNNTIRPDVEGAFISGGYNLIGNVGSVTGFTQMTDQQGNATLPLDPVLDALAVNGGSTPTHRLMGGSPAIDKGASFGETADQRNLPRIFDDPNIAPAAGGDNADIGAFEAQSVQPSLGSYPNKTVALSANTTVIPASAPSSTTSISVSTSTNFKGTFTANTSTGVVRITNAHPAGTYAVKVKAFGATEMASRTFTLTVESGDPCADPLSFTNAPDVPINSFPQAIAIGDFNEDGRQDFVTGYDSFTPASVRFGNGAGGFTGTTTISAEPFIRSIAVGDFNEDGHQDLALSNNSGIRSVSIRFGDGAGNFSGTTNVAVGNIPTSVAIGDFNGDGHQDFATANEIDNTVSIRFGDGAGNFSGTTEIGVGTDTESVVIGDFNGDSNQDFATANSGSASIRLGDGAGGFTSAPDVPLDITFARCIVTGDFNEDGHQDIAISGSSLVANLVSVRLGDGAGNFTGTTDVLVSSGPERMVTGDFNNDGHLDFATANVGFGTLSLRLGDGAGNFTGFTPTSEITVGTNPRPLATGDFNGDGKQDFVVAHFNDSNFAAVRLNNSCPPPNTPPIITAAGPLSRQKGSSTINSQIATVSDAEQAANTLSVTATSLTGSGVTITNISIDANGNVTADVAADCAATNSTFTLTVTDNFNVTATDVLTVNVTADAQPPVITCPENITQSTDTDQCSATVTYATPTASDNCPGVGAVICAPASGSAFPKGVTTVTCAVSDASGNDSSCSFTVTINDTQAPTVSCPANIARATDANLCSAVVSFSATASDNCSGATVSCIPASGSVFPKGVTTVSCMATDASGNQSAPCSFTVTVNDNQAPTVGCPANIARATDANLCSAVVSFAAPTVSDNCPGVGTPVCNPPSGSAFPKGITTVTCAVQDASGNQSACSFTVTVNDTQAPTLVCPPNQVAAIVGPTGSTVVVNYPSPLYSDSCPGASVVCSPPSGSAFPVGLTTVTCAATDASGNQTVCSFIVTTFNICLQDDSNPAIVILLNSFTGDYLFCVNGSTWTGRGTVQKQGNLYTLTHNTPGRRVLAKYDGSQNKGTASLQSPVGTMTATISDRDTRNNACSCSSE